MLLVSSALLVSTANSPAKIRGDLAVELIRPTGGPEIPSLQLAVNNRLLALLPPGDSAVLTLRPASNSDPHEIRLQSADGAYAFRFRLGVGDEGAALIEPAATDACTRITLRVVPSPPRVGAQTLQLYFEARSQSIEPQFACQSETRSIGPSAMWKLRFTSQPAGASVFMALPKGGSVEYRRVEALTPLVYVTSIGATVAARIFFKKPGYADCVRVLTVQRGAVPMLRASDDVVFGKGGADQRAQQPLLQDPSDAEIPEVRCELRPLPIPS